MTPRSALLLTLLLLFGLPPVVSAGYAAASTPAGDLYALRLTDGFATAGFVAFLVLLVIAFVSGPTRSHMLMTRDFRVPRAQLRLHTQGRVDFSHASFPLQVLAGIAAICILVEALAVSALA